LKCLIYRSKQISAVVTGYIKELEDLWKKSRWIMELISVAREKSNSNHQLSTKIILFKDLENFFFKINLNIRPDALKCNKSCVASMFKNEISYGKNLEFTKNIFDQITDLYKDFHPNHSRCHDSFELISNIYNRKLDYHHIDSLSIDEEDELSRYFSLQFNKPIRLNYF